MTDIPTYNIPLKQGNTGIVGNPIGLVLTVKETDPITGELVLQNLTGKTYHFFVRWSKTNQVTKEIGSGITVDLLLSTVTTAFTTAETSAWPLKVPITYELEERNGGGDEATILQGRILVEKGFNTNV